MYTYATVCKVYKWRSQWVSFRIIKGNRFHIETWKKLEKKVKFNEKYQYIVYVGNFFPMDDLIHLPVQPTICKPAMTPTDGRPRCRRTSSARISSRLIWRWRMFRRSVKTMRAGGTRWLHGMRFSGYSNIWMIYAHAGDSFAVVSRILQFLYFRNHLVKLLQMKYTTYED